MPLPLIFLAAAVGQIEACAAAVHGDLVSAATVCATPKESINLFAPTNGPSCPDVLTAGVQAGKYGPKSPEVVRQGLIRDFDQKLASCQAPGKSKPPTIKTTNLWD